jgi:hypothetical protein
MKGVLGMRASRCSALARIESRFAVVAGTLLIPLLLLALLARPSLGANDPTAEKAAKAAVARAESIATANEGFSVRVVEDQSGAKTTKRTYQIKGPKGATRVTVETPEPPDVPATPDVPAPPDFGTDRSSSNDLVRFGEDITIPASKVVEGDVVAFGGSITVLGHVKGSCTAIGGSVRVEGKGVVDGDAVSMGGTVSTGDSATVSGSNVSLGSFNAGHVRHWGPWMGAVGALSTGAWLLHTIFWLAMVLLFGWLSLVLLRDRLLYANRLVREQFGKSFLWGLLGWVGLVFAVPVGIVALVLFGALAIVILCVTIIGIPVAILVAIAMVLGVVGLVAAAGYAIFLGYIEGAMFLGDRVFGRKTALKPLVAIIIGAALIAALKGLGELAGAFGFFLFQPIAVLLGIASGFLLIILTTAGLGGLILGRFRTGPAPGTAGQWAFAGAPGGGPTAAPAAPPAAGPSPEAPPAGGLGGSPAGVHEPQPVAPPPAPPTAGEGGSIAS